VTGNLILNEGVVANKNSLILVPAASSGAGIPTIGVAITGNVFRGAPSLPARPLAAPLNVWDVLNTIVP